MAFTPSLQVGSFDYGNPFDVVLDNSGPNNQALYEGTAHPGTLVSVTQWRIRKFFFDGNGNVQGWRWANGSTDFSYEWDERQNYDYASF